MCERLEMRKDVKEKTEESNILLMSAFFFSPLLLS